MLASTALDRAERICIFDRSTVGVPGLESTQLLSVLNEAVKEYFASFEKAGEPPTLLKKEYGYTLIEDTALDGDLASGAVSTVCEDTSELGSSGAIAIWDNNRPDYVEFSANNLTTTLTTTQVSFAHEDGDIVSLLYALPATFDSFRSEEGFEDGVSVDGDPYFFTSGNPEGWKFALYDNGTTKYLHFPQGLTGDVFVRYNGIPTVVDGESDTIDIPTKDEAYGVWKVVEYAAPILEKADLYQIARANALRILGDAHIRRNIGKRPRLRPMRRMGGFTRTDIFD
jgi:hypothetical protein